jgi:threonine/homoserine/homoserine lactone efflux protein
MNIDVWLAFAFATIILVVIPGPTIMLVVSYALNIGRKETIAMVAGVTVGDMLAMSISLLGLGAIIAASPLAFSVMKWAGAIYLCVMGARMILKAPLAEARIEAVSAKTPFGAFRDAGIVTLLNPKSIGFFIAFVPQFVDQMRPLSPQLFLMFVTFVTLGSLNAMGYALLATHVRERIKKPTTLQWMQRAGGGVLIALAAATAAPWGYFLPA